MTYMLSLTKYNRTLWKSISTFSYYREVVKQPFSSSFFFYIFFSIFVGSALTLSIMLALYQPLAQFRDRFQKRAPYLYPHDLVITIDAGKLSTNVREPVRFPFPYELFTEVPGTISDSEQKHLFTIDTDLTLAEIRDMRSLFVATATELHVLDDAGHILQSHSFTNIDKTTINKATYDYWLTIILPMINYLPLVFALGLILVFIVLWPIARLFSLVVLSFILYILAKSVSVDLSYSKIYQIGLHAIVLPTLIQIAMAGLGLVPPIPFFNTILYLLYSLVILAELRRPSLASKPKK